MTDTEEVNVEIEVPHPPARVWRALTEPALLEQWLMKTDFVPELGKRFRFQAPSNPGWDGTIRCEIIDIDEPHSVSFTWKALGVETVVRWALQPLPDGGTRLQITQTGFRHTERQAFAGARAAWRRMASTLAELLDGLDSTSA